MTTKPPLVGLLITQGLLRSPHQHPCGQGHYGVQFLKALSNRLDQHPNIRLLADHPNTQKECMSLLERPVGSTPWPWLASEQWGQLDILHSFEPSPLPWVRKRGRSPFDALQLSGTLSHWDATELQAMVLENFRSEDVLFCASDAAKASVKRLWQHEIMRLQRRLGPLATAPQLPQLLRASAGIALQHEPFTEADRLAARTTLRVAPKDLLIVQAGRADPARGFDPTVLYRVVAEVQKRITRRLQILDCCSFVNDGARQATDRVARDLGLTIKRAEIQRPEYLMRCLAAADLYAGLQMDLDMGFTNLHLQAMSAGLACVLSDWAAHRHAISNGQDGSLVATTIAHRSALPAPLQAQTAPWCELTSIDFEQAVLAIQTLCTADDLRQNLAQRAREKSQEHHWDRVLQHYQTCWEKQHQQRQPIPRAPRLDPAHPALSDLYRPFASRMFDQSSNFWPLLGTGEGGLSSQATRLLTDKAPPPRVLPKEQQTAILKDNTQLLQWLRSRNVTGGHAQAAAQTIGRTAGQRLADLARLAKLGMVRTQAQSKRDLMRPLQLLHADIQPHQQVALQQLSFDGRIILNKEPETVLEGLRRGQDRAAHICWLGAHAVVRDYWLYERLQEAFAQFAVVLPQDINRSQLPAPELEQLPWLAIRHDALPWFLENFVPPVKKRWKTRANPWLKLFNESQRADSPGRMGTWTIDISTVKETP